MAKLWKGIRNVFTPERDNFFQPYSVFSNEMTIKLVFVGGHQSGKSAIVKILNKEKFPVNYIPTLGIDQYKIRLDRSSENSQWLWIWDVSHAELGGVHESLIFHQAHGIVLVADLTNFSSIQAVDEWLHSISSHLKNVLDHSVDPKDSDSETGPNNTSDATGPSSGSNLSSQHSIGTVESDDANLDEEKQNSGSFAADPLLRGSHASAGKRKDASRNKNKNSKNNNKFGNVWMPRLYLLVSKYDQSDEPILTDKELHKFCKSNAIRAFARISAKLDARSDMLEVFETFASDIMRHCPIQQPYSNVLQEETDRFRYYYAIKRMQKNKLDMDQKRRGDGTIFGIKLNEMRTFKWGENVNVLKSDRDRFNSDDEGSDDSSDDAGDASDGSNSSNYAKMRRKDDLKGVGGIGANGQKKLVKCEEEARRVLLSMRECVEVQRKKVTRDWRDYEAKQKKALDLGGLGGNGKKSIALGDGKSSITITYQSGGGRSGGLGGLSGKMPGMSAISGMTGLGGNKVKVSEMSKRESISKKKFEEKLIEFEVIAKLKLEMLNGLESEIDNLTECWEDELNTIVEMIRFQMPLTQIADDIHKLSQQIVAREMIFKRRLRLVYSLRSPNRDDLNQVLMQLPGTIEPRNDDLNATSPVTHNDLANVGNVRSGRNLGNAGSSSANASNVADAIAASRSAASSLTASMQSVGLP